MPNTPSPYHKQTSHVSATIMTGVGVGANVQHILMAIKIY